MVEARIVADSFPTSIIPSQGSVFSLRHRHVRAHLSESNNGVSISVGMSLKYSVVFRIIPLSYDGSILPLLGAHMGKRP
jgi:hypothetical protein